MGHAGPPFENAGREARGFDVPTRHDNNIADRAIRSAGQQATEHQGLLATKREFRQPREMSKAER